MLFVTVGESDVELIGLLCVLWRLLNDHIHTKDGRKMRMFELLNETYRARIHASGAMTDLSFVGDPYEANFLLSAHDEPWVPANKQWGLGFVTVGDQKLPFDQCVEMKQTGNTVVARFLLAFTQERVGCVWSGDREESRRGRALELIVTRTLAPEGLWETFELFNRSELYIALDEVGLYSSFHNTYASGENALQTHMNQHFWMGGDLSYIEAQRQSGIAPHMGLITLEGCFTSYQVEELNSPISAA